MVEKLRHAKAKEDSTNSAVWRTVAHQLADDKEPSAKLPAELSDAMHGLRLTADDLAADVAAIRQHRATKANLAESERTVAQMATECDGWQATEARLLEEARALRAKAFRLGQLEGGLGQQAALLSEMRVKHPRVLV